MCSRSDLGLAVDIVSRVAHSEVLRGLGSPAREEYVGLCALSEEARFGRLARLAVIDADGVLLDFHVAYASAWQRVFGTMPAERDPLAYWPIDRWHVEALLPPRLDTFHAAFDEDFWGTVPLIDGAVEACERLQQAGHDLVRGLGGRHDRDEPCGGPQRGCPGPPPALPRPRPGS